MAGLVLVDPAPEEFYPRFERERPGAWASEMAAQQRRVAAAPAGHRGEWAVWDSTMAQARASDAVLRTPITRMLDAVRGGSPR